MAQEDYVISDQTGISFLSDLNDTLEAIVSNNSGSTEPATMYAYMFWADTTSGILKQRNAANIAWIDKDTLATANLGFESIVKRATPSNSTISTTERVEDTLTLEIPASWNTYDVELNFSASIDETGTASAGTGIKARFKAGSGTGGTLISKTNSTVGNIFPDDRVQIALFGFQEALTVTGSVTWSLTAQADSDNNDYSLEDMNWQVRAFRIS